MDTSLKGLNATIKGLKAMHAVRKGQAAPFPIQRHHASSAFDRAAVQRLHRLKPVRAKAALGFDRYCNRAAYSTTTNTRNRLGSHST